MKGDIGFSIRDAMDAAEKKSKISGWKAYAWESASGGHIVTGETPAGVYLKGPRKGKDKYNGLNKMTIVVSESELKEAASSYEEETGKCWNCKGGGKVFSGWSAKEGTTYRPCDRCGGRVA